MIWSLHTMLNSIRSMMKPGLKPRKLGPNGSKSLVCSCRCMHGSSSELLWQNGDVKIVCRPRTRRGGWQRWLCKVMYHISCDSISTYSSSSAFARIENHYFINGVSQNSAACYSWWPMCYLGLHARWADPRKAGDRQDVSYPSLMLMVYMLICLKPTHSDSCSAGKIWRGLPCGWTSSPAQFMLTALYRQRQHMPLRRYVG